MPKIGMITVGQSPRDDIVPAMSQIIGPEIEIIQKGALDGLSNDEVDALTPGNAEKRLCTRLADGKQVVVAEEQIFTRMQAKVDDLNQAGVDLIVFLCTGHFPRFEGRCLILEAQKIVDNCVAALVDDRYKLGIVVPLAEQMAHAKQALYYTTSKIHAVNASPYEPLEAVHRAAAELQRKQVDLVVMHCMGFSNDHRLVMRQATQKPVLVANSIVARTLSELFD